MNLKQAKSKLAEASRSTGTKHVKILVADLCSVMKFMLDEIERLNTLLAPINTDPGVVKPISELPWEMPSPPKPRLNAGDTECSENDDNG